MVLEEIKGERFVNKHQGFVIRISGEEVFYHPRFLYILE